MTYEELLKNNKLEHIAYIITVSDYCGLNYDPADIRNYLLELDLDNIYRISLNAEILYKGRKELESMLKLEKEIKELGIDEVKRKYLSEVTE